MVLIEGRGMMPDIKVTAVEAMKMDKMKKTRRNFLGK